MGEGELVVSSEAAGEAGLEPGKSRPERSKSNDDFSSLGASAAGAASGAGALGAMSKSRPEDADCVSAGSGARLIVRSVTRGAEAGREMPGGRDIVLLDDAVQALYLQVAELATPAGARLTAVFPRTSRRVTFSARREAADGGTRVQLTGEVTGTLLLDGEGRLVRLELPATGTVVTRAAK